MKTQINDRPAENTTAINHEYHTPLRQHTKSSEHRHERRKLREQLRRLDWAPSVEDEIFA